MTRSRSSPRLKFYDVRSRSKFSSSDYKHVTRGKTKFAVANSPKGNESWRIVGRSK